MQNGSARDTTERVVRVHLKWVQCYIANFPALHDIQSIEYSVTLSHVNNCKHAINYLYDIL